jgi:HEAT repeat protein
MTPRERIQQECDARGRTAFVADCIAALQGREIDTPLVVALGGPASTWFLSEAGPESAYWLRVWAARGLMWAWDEAATNALAVALDDESWRVREMALKVIARNNVEDLLAKAAELQDDPVPRVRSAAGRALVRLSRAPS